MFYKQRGRNTEAYRLVSKRQQDNDLAAVVRAAGGLNEVAVEAAAVLSRHLGLLDAFAAALTPHICAQLHKARESLPHFDAPGMLYLADWSQKHLLRAVAFAH